MSDAPAPAAAQFSMSEAASDAFRKRGQRFVLLKAALAYLGVAIAIMAAQVYVMGDAFTAYLGWVASMSENARVTGDAMLTPPPREVTDAIPAAILFAIISNAAFAAYEAASLRWLVRGEQGGGLFGLRLDADTARVFLTYLCWLALLFAYAFMVSSAVVVIVGLTGGPASPPWVRLLGAFVFYGGLVFVAVRFAPAAALSIARRKFSFLDARHVTRGKFWGMFGAFAFYTVIFIAACFAVAFIAGLASFGAALREVSVSTNTAAALEAMNTPGVWGAQLAFTAIGTVAWLITAIAFFGINAYAVKDSAEAANP